MDINQKIKPKFIPRHSPIPNKTALAIQLHTSGKSNQAEDLYKKILKKDKKNFDCLHMLGVLYQQQGLLEKSINYLKQALSVNPYHVSANSNLGNAYQQLDKFDIALKYIDKALELDPNFPEALFNKAVIFYKCGQWANSMYFAHLTLNQVPNNSLAMLIVGNSALKVEEWYEAELFLKKYLSFDKNNLGIHIQIANSLHQQGKLDESLVAINQAINLDSSSKEAYLSRASILKSKYANKEALSDIETVLEMEPNNPTALMAKSEFLLRDGNYQLGWELYEYRKKIDDWSKVFSTEKYPILTKDVNVRNKKILVTAEQGYGDNFQFIRLVSILAKKGADVYFGIQPDMHKILSNINGITKIIYANSELPCPMDYQVSLLSLPYILNINLTNIPSGIPYIQAIPDKSRYWQGKLSSLKRPKVGITWCAGVKGLNPDYVFPNIGKSINLAEFKPLSKIDVDFISLQKGNDAERSLRELKLKNWGGPEIHNFVTEIDDFSDTAALIENLDLVITVCTSIAHLSGAMGKPTWVLIKKDSCWRWLLNRNDSPWYPSVRLFRQPEVGDWTSVIKELTDALQIFSKDYIIEYGSNKKIL